MTPTTETKAVAEEFVESPKWVSATLLVANIANVIIVLSSLFALGSVFFAPSELNGLLLRSSLYTALGASAISIVAHIIVWASEKMHPERPHAVQHWLSAHAASAAGFVGANWMWFHP